MTRRSAPSSSRTFERIRLPISVWYGCRGADSDDCSRPLPRTNYGAGHSGRTAHWLTEPLEWYACFLAIWIDVSNCTTREYKLESKVSAMLAHRHRCRDGRCAIRRFQLEDARVWGDLTPPHWRS